MRRRTADADKHYNCALAKDRVRTTHERHGRREIPRSVSEEGRCFSTAMTEATPGLSRSVCGDTSVAPIRSRGADKAQTCPTPFDTKEHACLEANR